MLFLLELRHICMITGLNVLEKNNVLENSTNTHLQCS